MKLRSLEQMEARAAATPTGAVLLWLAEYVKDNSPEHMTGLDPAAWGDGHREQVRGQLDAAIRAEMRGEKAEHIEEAVRQAKMEAEFLIQLVMETERYVFSGIFTRMLRIDLAREQLRNAELRGALNAAELSEGRGQHGGKMDARKRQAANEANEKIVL